MLLNLRHSLLLLLKVDLRVGALVFAVELDLHRARLQRIESLPSLLVTSRDPVTSVSTIELARA